MSGEPRIVQHKPGIAAHGKMLAGLDAMVLVEHKHMRMMRYRATINHGLTVVLTGWLQSVQLEQSVGCRVKADVPGARSQFRIADGDTAIINQPGIGKAMLTGQVKEIVPVQRATQALAV